MRRQCSGAAVHAATAVCHPPTRPFSLPSRAREQASKMKRTAAYGTQKEQQQGPCRGTLPAQEIMQPCSHPHIASVAQYRRRDALLARPMHWQARDNERTDSPRWDIRCRSSSNVLAEPNLSFPPRSADASSALDIAMLRCQCTPRRLATPVLARTGNGEVDPRSRPHTSSRTIPSGEQQLQSSLRKLRPGTHKPHREPALRMHRRVGVLRDKKSNAAHPSTQPHVDSM